MPWEDSRPRMLRPKRPRVRRSTSHRLQAGELVHVLAGQATAGRGDQAEHGAVRARQQCVQLLGGARPDIAGRRGHPQRRRRHRAQGVTGADVGGQVGGQAAGDHDVYHGPLGQQTGDAAFAGRPAGVLVQSVDHQHQPTTGRPGTHRRRVEQPSRLTGAGVQHRARRLTHVRRQLLKRRVQERVAVGLARVPAGDEERHHVHARGRVGREPRQQCRLARPRPCLPPQVRLRSRAEPGQLVQFVLAVEQLHGAIDRGSSW